MGVTWLLLLPLNDYSRNTYISENALLPGQVHTYFSGSDQNIFRGFKKEVDALTEASNVEYGYGSAGRRSLLNLLLLGSMISWKDSFRPRG